MIVRVLPECGALSPVLNKAPRKCDSRAAQLSASSLRPCSTSNAAVIRSSRLREARRTHGVDVQSRKGLTRAMGLPVGGPEADTSAGEVVEEASEKLLNPRSVVIPVGDRQITIETGRMGRHASGAVTVRDGDTIIYCTACADHSPTEPGDFAPLSVTYQERFSAAGRTSGGFFKREGKPKDHEVLTSRLMDRPIRPMMAKGFNFETQILAWVLSYDEEHSPDALAIVAAGAALAVSDIPVAGIVAGVRVGLIDGKFIVNPRVQQMEQSKLDLIVAGTQDSVLMIEGYCEFLTEEQLLEAVEVGQQAVASICGALAEWTRPGQGPGGKPKRTDALSVVPPELAAKIEAIAHDGIDAALRIKIKKVRGQAMSLVEKSIMEQLTSAGRAKWRAEVAAAAAAAAAAAKADALEPGSPLIKGLGEDEEAQWDEEEGYAVDSGDVDQGEIHIRSTSSRAHWNDETDQMYTESEVRRALKTVISNALRRIIVKEGVRSDGRGVAEVRTIDSQCGLLPRTHGSALFSRGETQSLAVAVIGSEDMAQRLDSLSQDETKRFYLHYNFPPSSVGETGRMGVPSRREIGHGTLAERALEPCIPPPSVFPYTMRLESNITESNGSSSMASVCGGCLALLDAGVPLISPVAGVAMGLILKTEEVGGTGEPVVLTDILGSEDALGDMDFKVAGNETGVTAFQMDIKVTGITTEVMRQALEQAKAGRIHILKEMAKADPPPQRRLSPFAPRCERLKIAQDKISAVIGTGGKTIRSIVEESKADNIDIQDTGEITIYAKTEAALEAAKRRIEALTMTPQVGKVYRNCPVKAIQSFGCFVEIAPGKEGMVHVSELSTVKVDKVEDVVTVGQLLDVKLLEVNSRGQLRLSHKAVLLDAQGGAGDGEASPESGANGASPAANGGGRPAPARGGEERGQWKRGAAAPKGSEKPADRAFRPAKAPQEA